MHFKTLSIHAGQSPEPAYRSLMTPIYQTSTFAFEKVSERGAFDYSRNANPTRRALEECLAALEGGSQGFAFATGTAAATTALALLKKGDHIIAHDDLYGGTYQLMTTSIRDYGIEVDFVNMRDLAALQKAVKSNTRLIWSETPTNPLMNLLDLEKIAALARKTNITTLCDNTFMSPYFQRPLSLGIDIVLHSTTKYINGHSDVVGGALVVADAALAERIKFHQIVLGTCAGPFDCFLVLRGIKTLGLRMEEHSRNALALAQWLENHPKVERVLHPGLASHPQHELARRQMSGYSGTFSFTVKGGQETTFDLLRNVQLFTVAVSLGGVESLIEHPFTMTHTSMPEEVREKIGITRNMIRISVGLEHIDDLITDLEQAFAKI